MARNPASYGPSAKDLLNPPPFTPPTVPMTLQQRLRMDAILRDPDADEPRLKYADWEEEYADPVRAKFIRMQVANPDKILFIPNRYFDPNSPPEAIWIEPYAEWGARDVVFRRGFAEAMSLTGRSFISLSDGLFAATPLREVRLIAVNTLMDELVQCPNLGRLARLNLWGNQIGIPGITLLSHCPYLSTLRELNVGRNGLGDEGVRFLLSAGWVKNLRTLIVGDNHLSPQMEQELIAAFGPRVLHTQREFAEPGRV
jgi:uncharacterized protein (TIGR02996 family)